jgi:alkanesulfonate monooxygenase SsuD/methylene tetrahydromethanopterin reductase-like flavin-dependent oxidoreductase (luciferase family)
MPTGSRSSTESHMQPLVFGVNVSTSAAPDADPVGQAQAAEDLGFDFVSASDHPSGDHPTYETWTMLTWMAASTSRIRIASRVLSLPFRSPALVAKMAESLDRLACGRLILGLGAGAADAELRAFGLPVPSTREKIEGLVDAMHIIRGLWGQPTFTYSGTVHRTDAAELEPKPERSIPIWLGAFGDRALAVTGRYADGWIPSLGYAPFDQLAVMRGKVLAAAQAAGRAPGDVTCALNLQVSVGDGNDPDPDVLAGSPEEIVARLDELVGIGFTAFNFMPTDPQPAEQIEQLAKEVLPVLRARTRLVMKKH